jgi:hypothetical protein
MSIEFIAPGGVKEKMLQTNAQGVKNTNYFFDMMKDLDTSYEN